MSGNRFLTAEWRYLGMINYAIDPGVLLPLVPRGTELDLWENRAFVSVVGFLFLGTRVLGLPIPFHRDFEEINLRFYVRRQAPEGWRRGVVFVREIVPRWAIATVARLVYNENYIARRMDHRIDLVAGTVAGNGSVEYWWREGVKRNQIRVRTAGDAERPMPGSEAEFITEHYWGYATQRDGGCVEYQVEHRPWRVWRTSDAKLACDVARVYGARFVESLGSIPSSAFVAEGSPVVVQWGVRTC
jgi:uncharacterized protein YqjF (DUF2071 family)